MFHQPSTSTSILPILNPSVTRNSKLSNYNWKTWAKAGLVFATTTGAFFALKATGSFSLISSWLRHTGTNLVMSNRDDTVIKIYSEHEETQLNPVSFKPDTTLQYSGKTHRLTDFEELSLIDTPQRAKRNPEIPKKIGQEFQVNTYTVNAQSSSSIDGYSNGEFMARLSDGKFVVTWTSNGQDGDDRGIYGQLFNANGTKFLSEFQVNTYTTGAQEDPSAAGLSDDKFVITWTSHGQDGSNGGIYAQLFFNNGTKIDSEFLVNSYTYGSQYDNVVANLSYSKFVVAWYDSGQDGSLGGVYSQLFFNNGTKEGSEFRVNTYVISEQGGPHITNFDDGKFMIVWSSISQENSGYGIYGQLYNNNGAKIGSELHINTYTVDNQHHPTVTNLSNRSVVIWESYGQDKSGRGIYGQICEQDGTKINSEFQVNTNTAGDQRRPAVTNLNQNRFAVVWGSEGQDGSSWGIYGQIFSNDGEKIDSEFQINTYTSDTQHYPSIANLNDDGFVVTWQSNGQDGNETGIYGQLFSCNSIASIVSPSSSSAQKSSSQTRDIVSSSSNKISSSSSENRSRSSEIPSSSSILSSESVVSGESKAVSSSKSVGAIPESGFSEEDHSPGITTNSLLTILGSLGGAIGVVTSIIGVWFKYKEYKNASKMYQQNPFAAEIRKGGNIDVSNFGSNEGQRYLKLIDDMANKLEEQGIDIEGMDQEDLRTLTLQSVAVIKEEVEPKEVCCWRKIIPVEELEKRQDAIIAGAVNTFTETRHRDGIAMQAVSSKLETKTEEKGSAVSGRINLDELSKFKKIGQGAFGIVYKAKYHGSNVAVKQLPMHMIEMDPKALDDFRREAELMEKLRHPHVVQFFGYYQDATHYSIVMEFVSGGTLDKALYDKQKPFPWYPTRWYMAHDIASAISFLHNNTVIRIIHRDLKSQNVLVYYQGDRMRAKVADIGIAKVMKEEDAGDTMTKGMGTPLWMAPEVVEAQGRGEKITYDEKVDVYSYGIILSELVNRALPFSEIKNRFDVIPSVLRGERPAVDKESAPINFVSLMEQCWAHRASERPMMKKVVKTLDQMKEEMRSFNTPASQPM